MKSQQLEGKIRKCVNIYKVEDDLKFKIYRF